MHIGCICNKHKKYIHTWIFQCVFLSHMWREIFKKRKETKPCLSNQRRLEGLKQVNLSPNSESLKKTENTFT